MIKTSAAALLISTALMTGAVIAQTNTTPAPSITAPAANAGSGAAATSGSAQFLTEQDRNQFRASKFVGLAIYGQDDQRIGDVNEILIDASGNAKAIVLGVGGFLGIGEKSVAVPFSAVDWVMERPAGNASAGASGTANTGAGANTAMNTNPPAGNSASAGMGTAATAGSTAGAGMGTGTGTTASRDTSVTGSTNASPARSSAETAASNGYPDHGKVRMSKADLQNAPAFKYYGETKSNAAGASNATPAAGGTAPRQ